MKHLFVKSYTKTPLTITRQKNLPFNKKGGDKLTLNLTGLSNLSKNTNNGPSNVSSPLSKTFPSPPVSANATKTESANLISLDGLHNDTTNQLVSLNGVITPTATTTDTVTVTHYSEQRGTMEKISVPSLNIFNAEFKPDKQKNIQTNPFLNLSPTTAATTTTITPTSTNPFMIHEPLTTIANPIVSESNCVALNNNNTKSDDEHFDNHNEENHIVTALVNKINPFKNIAAIDEIDNEHTKQLTDKVKANNIEAFNNYKNNNSTSTINSERTVADETEKNKINDEVNNERKIVPFCSFKTHFLLYFSQIAPIRKKTSMKTHSETRPIILSFFQNFVFSLCVDCDISFFSL